jgi:hypothetical protein
MGPMCLKLHYRLDPLLELNDLKDIVEGSSMNVNFLNNKSRETFFVFLIMNSLSEDLDVCSLTDWKSVLWNLLSMKVVLKKIVYICNHKFLNNLVVKLQEEDFMGDISMEYEFY